MNPVTIDAKFWYSDDLTSDELTYQFIVYEYDCRPQTTPAIMTILANSEPSKSMTYTDYAAIGIDTV